MRKAFLMIFLFTATLGFSQMWEPFVFGQSSYYKQQNDNSAIVENILLDSVLHKDNDVKVLYFNAKPTFDIDLNCYITIRQSYLNEDYIYRNQDNKIDTLIQLNDSILYIYRTPYQSNKDTFIFKPYAKLGDQWISNGINIECTEIGISTIFGLQDSIKTYSCSGTRLGRNYNGIEFILSKSYGLIKYLPFSDFINNSSYVNNFSPYLELAGLKNGINSYGYIQPDFSDYFHLNVGDKLFWHYKAEPEDLSLPRTEFYYIDSITYSFISPDSVYYEYERSHYSINGIAGRIDNSSAEYLRKTDGVMLNTPAGWFGPVDDNINDAFFLSELSFKVENNDTITFANFTLNYGMSDCTLYYATTDYDVNIGYSTRYGYHFEYVFSWGSIYRGVVGSIINGEKSGITEVPSGIDFISMENYAVYPNPFNDYIAINSNVMKFPVRIEIYDFAGSLILTDICETNTINLEKLMSGIYILKVSDSDNVYSPMKLVKK